MKIFYSIIVFSYNFFIKIASFFNAKARFRYKGVKSSLKNLEQFSSENDVIWIHCASLGEFEQGRSLIEKIKSKYPAYKTALSFFSPSGFEIRKNYELADIVFYLPGDSKKNAKKVVSLLNPKFVFFVKYEFWYWYIQELKKQDIPIYLISGIFRKNQIFFKSYGSFYRKILKNFECLFVQNEDSYNLLNQFGINTVQITGDTRFDRVSEIALQRKTFELIDFFTKDKFVFIAGSTWKPDEEIIFNFINNFTDDNVVYIIVPHEIKKDNIKRIKSLSKYKTAAFTESTRRNISEAKVLIIDTVGMLSSIYVYADVAYVGGGFGVGIHNTLEAAVYGIPVIFGPKYHKFDEAKELIKRNAGFSISKEDEFSDLLKKMINNLDLRNEYGKNAEIYVKENVGASEKILSEIKL